MGEADLAAAVLRVARGDKGQIGAGGLDRGDEAAGQFKRAGADLGHADAVPDIERGVERRELQHRRRADAHPCGARGRAIAGFEGKGRVMAKPAREHGLHLARVARRDIDEGRAAGAGVQVFIGAARREIGARARQIDRHRARRMGQIPKRQRPRGMGRCGQRRHVVLAAGAVIDLGQHRHRHRFVDRGGDLIRRDGAQLIPLTKKPGQPLRHVKIGREIAGIGQDHPAAGAQLQGRIQRLKHLDRKRVAQRHRARLCPDQPPDPVAQPLGQVHPARLVPGGDQHRAPFGADRGLDPRGDGARQRPQRIAVQIDHARGQIEERLGGGEIGGHRDLLSGRVARGGGGRKGVARRRNPRHLGAGGVP